jgi:extracellular factor (EF) 3-hydroxypalmitic acid methyl ester biosynthesis protein
MLNEITSNTNKTALVWRNNRDFQAAGSRYWGDNSEGRVEALRLMKQFGDTVKELERLGWSIERIHAELAPSREIFATSSFMRRCQRWPRGYAGDFETIEYLASGVNSSVPGCIGWHFEEIILHSSIAQQHRNKLEHQAKEIVHALLQSRYARILSVACGGCLDWVPALPFLQTFAGEIVLNDFEPAALALAESRLRPATRQVRLEPGNVLRASKRLSCYPAFNLVIAGGLFDYLSDKSITFLLRSVHEDLLAPGGILLFTNLAEGNPWRTLMGYGSNWSLNERTERRIRELCLDAGIPASALFVRREAAGLAVLTTVVKAER